MQVSQPSISIIGFFLSSIGLGQAARNIAHSLETTDLQYSCIDIQHNKRDSEFVNKCSRYLPEQLNFVIVGLDSTESIIRQISSFGAGRTNYLFPFWELDRIPSKFIEPLSEYDEIIAPSQFIADTFQKYLDYSVKVIQQPVFVPQYIEPNIISDGVLKIFSMMDLASYVARKNPMGALDAFRMAFPPDKKDVELILKIKGVGDPDIRGKLNLACLKDSRIKVIDEDLDRNKINLLMSKCNVYLSLHRSEGFGFGPAEAMAAGKIVVATNYGGVTDFLNDSTGYPIEYKLTSVREGEYVYGENQMWAEPSIANAASVLQDIYRNYEKSLHLSNNGRQLMIDQFSFKAVGKKLVNFFATA